MEEKVPVRSCPPREEKSERGEGEAPTVRTRAKNYTIGSCWPLILR